MKIIQTFWTARQDPLKHGFGWTHPEYNLISWALSCLSLKRIALINLVVPAAIKLFVLTSKFQHSLK